MGGRTRGKSGLKRKFNSTPRPIYGLRNKFMANPKSKQRRKKFIFAGIVLAVVALALVAVFKKKDVVITVQQEKAARRNVTELVKASGKIQPVLLVKISP